MKNQGSILLACVVFITVNDVLAQAWTTLGGNYLRTDASTDGVVIGNIGSAPSPTVGLLVDGANLNTPTGEVFRTIGPSATATYWKLFRASDEMARLYVNSTGDGVFIRPMQTSGNVWVMNTDQDAFRIRHNASSTLNGWTLSRSGFASLGNGGNIGGSGNEKPWARLHLVHEGTGADNSMGWRPHMRNGVLGTGNNDLAYMGQMFDMTLLLDGEPIVKRAVIVGRYAVAALMQENARSVASRILLCQLGDRRLRGVALQPCTPPAPGCRPSKCLMTPSATACCRSVTSSTVV